MFGLTKTAARPTPSPAQSVAAPPALPLDYPLLRLSPVDAWTLKDACAGTVIFGATGSGKTSASGRAMAHAMLRAGFGGLVLCARSGERALWERYCAETGRSRSLIVFDGSGNRRFNFLEYEIARSSARGMLDVSNVVALFVRIAEAAGRSQPSKGDGNPFWTDSVKALLTYAIYALWSAHGQVTVADILEMAESAPRSQGQLDNLEWLANSFCFRTVLQMAQKPLHPLGGREKEATERYWKNAFAKGDERTSGNIVATLRAMVNPFLTGTMAELFTTTTNVVPELTHQGAIIVMDLPTLVWHEAGALAQSIVKYLWQRAASARGEDPTNRPIFLWADECQHFVSDYDPLFQSTARACRACTVYLTQNLPGLYHHLKTDRPEHAARSLLGNFSTKIFHANTDEDTNRWAAEMIGKEVLLRRNFSFGETRGTSSGESWGENEGWSISQGESEGSSWSESSGGSSGGSTGEGKNRGSGSSWSWSQPSDLLKGGSITTGNNRSKGTSTNRSKSWGINWGRMLGGNRGTSHTIGQSGGRSSGGNRGENESRSATQGASEVVDYRIQPSEFAALRTGGERNARQVDAIVVRNGDPFQHSRSVWLPCVFSQSS